MKEAAVQELEHVARHALLEQRVVVVGGPAPVHSHPDFLHEAHGDENADHAVDVLLLEHAVGVALL